MFRYMAFIWDAADRAQESAAVLLAQRLRSKSSNWRTAIDHPGICVLYTGERKGVAEVQRLGMSGTVFGLVFNRQENEDTGAASAKVTFDEQESSYVLKSRGRRLITHYWGNYVAILRDEEQRSTYIVRGPASSLPCLRTAYRQVQICFSMMGDYLDLQLPSLSIDWDFLRVHMIAPIVSRSTGLKEIAQLLPGECLSFVRGRIQTSVYWDVLDIARADVIDDAHKAQRMLRASVRGSVQSWAACHESVLLYISGGLDSSIVLACLTSAPKTAIACLTEYSPGADSDERLFARLMVKHSGCRNHVEQLRSSDVRLEAMLDAAPTPTPQGTHRRVEAARREADIAKSFGASAIFSGSGGDQLFFQNGAGLTVADFILTAGLRQGLGTHIYNAAQLERKSVWRVMWNALRYIRRGRRFDPLQLILQEQSLISPDAAKHFSAMQSTKESTDRERIPPGKLWHAHDLVPADYYYDPLGKPGDPIHISPLVSQPVIETVLRIPTYILMIDGWDRGLVRRAFEAELPPQIVRRRDKGGVEQHLFEILQKNRHFARKLLMEGYLSTHGLVDSKRIEDALSDRPSDVLKGSAEIYLYLATEAWLQTWVVQSSRAAA